MYDPLPKTLLLKKLHKEGISQCSRAEVLADGRGLIAPGTVVLYLSAFAFQLDRGVNCYALWQPGAALLAVDTRPLEKRESHFCALGGEQPGFDPSTCDLCIAAMSYINQMLIARMTDPGGYAGKQHPYKKQRDLPPGLLNDIHTGKISRQEARDVYNIPIDEDYSYS